MINAEKIHKESLIIDAHQDTILSIIEKGKDIFKRSDMKEVDIPRMREGNLDVAFFALYTSKKLRGKKAPKRLRELLACFEKIIKNKELKHVKKLDDMLNLGNKIGIVLSIEGSDGIRDNKDLEFFYKKGLRCASLTHNLENQYATGAKGDPKKGLKKKGEEIIKKMEELGIILDVSHLNEKSFWDVVKIAKKPFIASHSNCFELKKHFRNLKDDQIKAIAEKKGVIGINFWSKVTGLDNDVASLVDHIDYIVKQVGIDHVGFGSDFDGCNDYPKGMEDVSKIGNITKELVKRGYSEEDIKKVLGMNHFRVFKEVCD